MSCLCLGKVNSGKEPAWRCHSAPRGALHNKHECVVPGSSCISAGPVGVVLLEILISQVAKSFFGKYSSHDVHFPQWSIFMKVWLDTSLDHLWWPRQMIDLTLPIFNFPHPWWPSDKLGDFEHTGILCLTKSPPGMTTFWFHGPCSFHAPTCTTLTN